jgi:anti-anti-sigma factor
VRRLEAKVAGRAVVVVRLHGESDLAPPDRARASLPLEGRLRPGTGAVILDLSRVAFPDGSVLGRSGVNALVGLADRCARADTRLILAGVPPPVRRALMTLDLNRVFTIVPSLWEAARLAGAPHAAPGRPAAGC